MRKIFFPDFSAHVWFQLRKQKAPLPFSLEIELFPDFAPKYEKYEIRKYVSSTMHKHGRENFIEDPTRLLRNSLHTQREWSKWYVDSQNQNKIIWFNQWINWKCYRMSASVRFSCVIILTKAGRGWVNAGSAYMKRIVSGAPDITLLKMLSLSIVLASDQYVIYDT